MNRRRTASTAMWVATVLVLSACGDAPAEVRRAGDNVVLIGPEGRGRDLAGIGLGGEVGMIGSCVSIGDAVTIWPHGTEVTSTDPLKLDVPDFGVVALGDKLEGGGLAYEAHDRDLIPSGLKIPSDCVSRDVIEWFPDHP